MLSLLDLPLSTSLRQVWGTLLPARPYSTCSCNSAASPIAWRNASSRRELLPSLKTILVSKLVFNDCVSLPPCPSNTPNRLFPLVNSTWAIWESSYERRHPCILMAQNLTYTPRKWLYVTDTVLGQIDKDKDMIAYIPTFTCLSVFLFVRRW